MGSEVMGEWTGSQWLTSRESHSLLNFFLSFCSFSCAFTYYEPMCAHMCMFVHIYVCEGQRTISGVFPQVPPTLLFV